MGEDVRLSADWKPAAPPFRQRLFAGSDAGEATIKMRVPVAADHLACSRQNAFTLCPLRACSGTARILEIVESLSIEKFRSHAALATHHEYAGVIRPSVPVLSQDKNGTGRPRVPFVPIPAFGFGTRDSPRQVFKMVYVCSIFHSPDAIQ